MNMTDTAVVTEMDQLPPPFRGTFTHWSDQRNSIWAPAWRDFHLDQLEPAILPWSIVVDVETGALDFRYRFWGTERTVLIGAEMTGRKISDIDNPQMRDGNMLEYQEVCRRRQPLLCETPVVTGSGRQAVFQSLRLPLSDDTKTVTHVFSAINYEQLSTAHYEVYGTVPQSRGWPV